MIFLCLWWKWVKRAGIFRLFFQEISTRARRDFGDESRADDVVA